MQHSKLLRTLELLREPEMKRLAKFLKSPFYNANTHIIDCYYHLRKYYPHFDSPKLTKEKVFQKLFPAHPYKHQKLLNLMSDFTALIEQFLGLLQLEKEEQEQQKLLLRALAGRKEAYELFVKKNQELHHNLDQSPYRDAAYFQEKFVLEQLYFDHPGTDKFKLTGTQYDRSLRHLEQYYVLEKLLLSCEMKSRESPLSEKHQMIDWQDLFAGRNKDFLNNPIASAYVEMSRLLESGTEESYFKLKKTFQENFTAYPKKQQQNMLVSLLNFAIGKGNRGNEIYVRENLQLYKIGLQDQLLFQQGKLNDRIYTNIALLAAKLKEFDWCLEFINDYETALEETLREDAKIYCLAYLYYGKKKDQLAIEYLHSIKFVNDYYQLGARVLLLRIYFETYQGDESFYDLLLTQNHALEKYLRRNDNISTQRRNTHLEFVLLLRQMIKLKAEPNKNEEKKKRLRLNIEAKAVAYKRWLLEQLEGVV